MESGWETFQFPGQPSKAKAGEILWERATLPVSSKEETLRFLSVDQIFQVYLDDTLLYHVGDPEHPDEMTTGNSLHLVRLPVIKNPSQLCFRIFSRTSNIGLNGKVSIGLGQNHLANLFKEEILKLIFIGIFFLIGVALILLFVLKFKEKGYLSFGLFLIVFSIWFISQTEIKALLIHSTMAWRFLDIFSLFQIPIWIMYFYIQIFGSGPWSISYRIFQIHSIYAIVAGALILFRLVQPEYLFFPFQIFALIGLIYLIVLSFMTAWKGDYEAKRYGSIVHYWHD